jgi:hypothetical protein
VHVELNGCVCAILNPELPKVREASDVTAGRRRGSCGWRWSWASFGSSALWELSSGLVGGSYFMCLASLGMLALAFGHSFCAGLTVPPDEPVV